MRQGRVGSVLAALCVAAASCGVLAIGLLAPPDGGIVSSNSPTRSGWPIAGAFVAPSTLSWPAHGPKANPRTAAAPAAVATPAPQPPPPPAPAPAPAPQPSVVDAPPERFVAQTSSGLPLPGEATGYGCAAALAYLTAYAAPGFWLVCPGVARGHQAMTVCQSGATPCSLMRIIVIADPCPAAYMNEASNSWAFMEASAAPLDPYGACT